MSVAAEPLRPASDPTPTAGGGAALVNRAGLSRRREVHVLFPCALIEPGVTQQEHYAHLRQHDWPPMLNVNGSSQETSLIANALDRGIGYFDSRAESLSALEVVLGNGCLIRTGFGHVPRESGGASLPARARPKLGWASCPVQTAGL